jgi:hypothetical protein
MVSKWDPESLKLDPSLVGKAKPRPQRRGRVRGRFIRGPVPKAWLVEARKLPGKSALSVGLALWHLCGVNQNNLTFKFTSVEAESWGID